MSYGLEIFRNNGVRSYSSDDVTWNQAGVMTAPANGSVSQAFPVISGREVLVVQIPINPPSLTSKTVAHNVSVSGTQVSASGGNTAAYILVLMR